jgi:hypothetical protein
MSDWYDDKDFAYGAYYDAVQQGNYKATFDNKDFWANKEFDNNNFWKNKDLELTNREWDYNTSESDKEQAKAEIEWYINNGVTTISPELIERSGLDQTAINQMIAKKQAEEAAQITNPDGNYNPKDEDKDKAKDKGNGGGYNNGSLSSSQVKQLQAKLGVTADGLWGSGSKDAAGGLSADDAWKKYFGDEGDGSLPDASGEERWDASGNYKDIDEDCKELLMTKGKEEVLAYLKRQLEAGGIDITSYMVLVNKYRN